eukprot:SAG31_NODE_1663_length_7581_cov_10.076399_7_plen_51_part_00
MDRRAQRIGAQRRQKHLERREQLAVQIEVRSYFLVFVPTIRETRDFYREM